MTIKVAVLLVGAGIQRDGTVFAAPSYVDGQWTRFQYGRPRKIGGYTGAFLNAQGISRGMILQSQNGETWVVSGFSDGLQQWIIDNDDAIGTGPIPITPLGAVTEVTIVSQGSSYTNGTYTNVPLVTTTGTGALATVVVSSNLVFSVTITNGGTNTYPFNESFTIANSSIGGTGSGFAGYISAVSSYYTSDATLWQFDIGYDPYGTGQNNLIAHPGQNLIDIDSTVNTRPLIGPFTGTTLSPVGVFTDTATLTSGSTLITFATTIAAIGAGVTVTGTGIPANTTVESSNLEEYGPVGTVSINTGGSGYTNGTHTGVSIVGNYIGSGAQATVVVTGGAVTSVTVTAGGSNYLFADIYTLSGGGIGAGTGFQGSISTLSTITANLWTAFLNNAATTSGSQTLTFDNNIDVSGGVVMLFPYLFVYGNYGLIQNCAAGDFNNWTSADSNANNVASTKVVKGLPLRGGTTSPAGLFWTLDSVVRVTYDPQTVGTSTLYWKYDLITQQSSIISSSCVIEYDGIFYWIGVDRFLMYNGVVQEVQNTQNLNWFFDNVNTDQRQKIWVSKIPRWGEIWWFYPRGDSEECNDAIIYNVREKCWYDAGSAAGAARSAGTFSEVFKKPIWAGNVQNIADGYTLWVHEQGTDEIFLRNVNAIPSYFETNVLGQSVGLVGNAQQPGDNNWTRVERIEPDFQQVGNMEVTITGKGYADDTDQVSEPYIFSPSTLKIDMKEQRREMRIRFSSNTQNGTYFMGRVVLSVESGDVRGTGNP